MTAIFDNSDCGQRDMINNRRPAHALARDAEVRAGDLTYVTRIFNGGFGGKPRYETRLADHRYHAAKTYMRTA